MHNSKLNDFNDTNSNIDIIFVIFIMISEDFIIIIKLFHFFSNFFIKCIYCKKIFLLKFHEFFETDLQ